MDIKLCIDEAKKLKQNAETRFNYATEQIEIDKAIEDMKAADFIISTLLKVAKRQSKN